MDTDEPLTFTVLAEHVHEYVLPETIHNMRVYCTQRPPVLWADRPPRSFLTKMIYVTLYRDLTRTGFCRLQHAVHFWLPISITSLQHNVRKIRCALKCWAKLKIELGSAIDWNLLTRNSNFPKLVQDTNLWIDSTDFPLERKKKRTKKSRWWSYKLNRPGRRFMIVCDAKRRIRKIWGGYSPKVDDRNWQEEWADYFEDNFHGGVIVGDKHFSWGRNHMTDPKWHSGFEKPRRPKRKRKKTGQDHVPEAHSLTKHELDYNAAITKIRGRVESPFAKLKTTWQSLAIPWGESPHQLDCLVWYAVGIFNAQL